jgi:hypothetical protein
MTTSFEMLTPILQRESQPPLSEDPALERARRRWKEDLSADPSAIAFYRLDRWWHVRHELLRQGRQVASRSTLGGMINSFLGGEPLEDDESGLDGSKLPPFERVRHYFGNVEAAAVTVEDGWLISGRVCR